MSRRQRAKQVMYAFGQGIQYESNVANALREAVEGLNIEPSPEKELSAEKHHFIRGQNWVKDAILRLADELDKISEE
jgi:ribosomal protein S12 methylthiotransferase accessory factor YcaO